MNPDDICGVCNLTRDQHGDMQHEFSADGVLKKKTPPPVPNNVSPAIRGMANDPTVRLVLRMVQRLTDKGLLEGDDLVYIFGGDYVYTEGEHAREAFGANSFQSPGGGSGTPFTRRDSGGTAESVDQS